MTQAVAAGEIWIANTSVPSVAKDLIKQGAFTVGMCNELVEVFGQATTTMPCARSSRPGRAYRLDRSALRLRVRAHRHRARGLLPAADGRVPMSDGAGEVVEAGPPLEAGELDPTCSGFAPGDRVISLFCPRWIDGPPTAERLDGVPGDHVDGYASEFVTVPARALTRAPSGFDHAQAATLPCAALTAWRALMVDGPVRPGQAVLIQGTGGVSLFALQFAKAAGATVIATSSSD